MNKNELKEMTELRIFQFWNPVTKEYEVAEGQNGALKILSLLEGITDTDGSDTMILDSTKDIEMGSLDNKLVKFTVAGKEYIRKIIGSIPGGILFETTRESTSAVATLGEEASGQGQVEISVAADGENYSVEFVAGTGVNSEARADYADGVLTIVSATDENEDPVASMPGNIQGLITANAEAAAIFTATSTFAGYGLPITFPETVIGEDDAITIGEGLPDQGSCQIKCIGTLIGEGGNEYSIEVVQGAATTADNLASLSGDTKVLTITVNLTADGDVRFMTVADLQTLLAGDEVTTNKFEVVIASIVAGALIPTTEPVHFAGAISGILVPSGTPYTVLDIAPEMASGSNLEEQKTQADAVENIITFESNIKAIEIYHEEATWQDFVVNGITLKVPAKGYRTLIRGTSGKTVTIPTGVDCIVSRLA